MEIRTIQKDRRVRQNFTFDTPWLSYAKKGLPDSNTAITIEALNMAC